MVAARSSENYFLQCFRTQRCWRLGPTAGEGRGGEGLAEAGGCQLGPDGCPYSHNNFWLRRCPYYVTKETNSLRYLPTFCPDIQVEGDVVQRNACRRGGTCPFAHSVDEQRYHPLEYKTQPCERYHNLGRCDVHYCPKWHKEGDERIIAHDYTLPYTRGVAIAPHPNVVIEDRDVVSVAGSNGPQKIQRLVRLYLFPFL
eukprot:GHVU01129703.1.p1 GENE.GHVU01129703.1~~GHVU01129703.1.p1  ORF type:complete len:199 (-),score=8.73 GHVU01129703.1:25-621(-)